MSQPQLDLRALAVDRSQSQATTVSAPPKRWISRYLLPAGLLVGFLGLFGSSVIPALLPRQSVAVIPVIVKKPVGQKSGTVMFQAPGWIEPSPTPIKVSALTTGVIEELLVVEGDDVEKGDSIARLYSVDAELVVAQARNQLEIRQAAMEQIEAEQQAAVVRLDRPLHLKAALASALSELAKAQSVKGMLPHQIASAKAELEFAEKNLQGKRAAKDAISERIVNVSERDYAQSVATLDELLQSQKSIDREIEALSAKADALEQQLELRIEERRQLDEANARLRSARALCEEARLQLDVAQLALDRTVIRAPVAGRILSLQAATGSSVNEGHFGGSTIVEMYDPKKLQVRADVRLEDVPKVTKGQLVEIRTPSASGKIVGRVLQLTSSANVQRNTLEVKVALIDPPETVSPEMLVAASFLAPEQETPSDTTEVNEAIFVPSQIVQTSAEGSFVWSVDAMQRAQKRVVELGMVGEHGLVEIKSGLSLTDKLIVSGTEGLKPGQRVAVTEDRSWGIQ
ncbi:MAG: efflux RND transporter periplasmic adaptor subunit [Pirellulaceae bacterium]|nr:efflux RND transporter periplasmic adaptor subunit [Pirellulaceae bacterium]